MKHNLPSNMPKKAGKTKVKKVVKKKAVVIVKPAKPAKPEKPAKVKVVEKPIKPVETEVLSAEYRRKEEPAKVEVKVEEVKLEPKVEEEKVEVSEKQKPLKKGFITGMGRRKEAKAGVFLWDEKGEFTVNGMAIEKYFSSDVDQIKWVRPFHAVGVSHPEARYSASVRVRGSGKASQLDAVVLAFAKALSKLDPEFDKTLRKLGFMTRDSRMVERKKPFLHKARKRPQYSKR